MKVRLTQLDGNIPNLAILKLAHWHLAQGDEIHLAGTPEPGLFEPSYDLVYGSAIFSWTAPALDRLRVAHPRAITGGTGSDHPPDETVEQIIGQPEYEHYDYSLYPKYEWSIGFTQRGCRLSCKFCVVPKKEGRPKSLNTIHDIWRKDKPKALLLLDNDFFGQPENQWRERIREIRDGGFRVSFNQGINVRAITDEAARALAQIEYRDDNFKRRRLYTAWDNFKDESTFFLGLDRLNQAGIPSRHVMVYMLVGYRAQETMEEILHRFNRLKSAGCLPYPMVYDRSNHTLRAFQRWAIRRYHEFVPWEEYRSNPPPNTGDEQQKLLQGTLT